MIWLKALRPCWRRMFLPCAQDHVNLYLIERAHGGTPVDTRTGNAAMRAPWAPME